MTEISSAQIKQLREQTGAGMMDCKKALVESKGNYQDAVDWLGKKGLAAAAKKASRTAAEGLVAIASDKISAAVIELNSETDFVARNDKFQALAKNIAEVALQQKGDVERIKKSQYPNAAHVVSDEISNSIATIGENLTFRRAEYLSVNQGIVATYMHSAIAPNLGKIGVLVAIESSGSTGLEDFGKKMAMHIAANRPEFISLAEVTSETRERQKKVFAEQSQTFLAKFNTFEQRMEPYKAKFQGERSFSEKQLEPKLDELEQFSQSLAELEADFQRKETSEDRKEKQEAERTKKMIGAFFQEAAHMLKRVRSYGDHNAIVQKLIDLKMARYFEESVLLEQLFVIDGKTKIAQVIEQASKEAGAPVAVKAFIRFQLGEGVEKQQTDFAAEVAAAVAG